MHMRGKTICEFSEAEQSWGQGRLAEMAKISVKLVSEQLKF